MPARVIERVVDVVLLHTIKAEDVIRYKVAVASDAGHITQMDWEFAADNREERQRLEASWSANRDGRLRVAEFFRSRGTQSARGVSLPRRGKMRVIS